MIDFPNDLSEFAAREGDQPGYEDDASGLAVGDFEAPLGNQRTPLRPQDNRRGGNNLLRLRAKVRLNPADAFLAVS